MYAHLVIQLHWKHILYICERYVRGSRSDTACIQDDFGFLRVPNLHQMKYSYNDAQEVL